MNTVTMNGRDRYETSMLMAFHHLTELMDLGLIEGPARLSEKALGECKKCIENGFAFNCGELEDLLQDILHADWDHVFDVRH